MKPPFPNMSVSFNASDFKLDVLDSNLQAIKTYNSTKDITNYEYEVKKNDEKRQILVLKNEYLGLFIDDLKNIMKYDQSSQFVDDTTKRV